MLSATIMASVMGELLAQRVASELRRRGRPYRGRAGKSSGERGGGYGREARMAGARGRWWSVSTGEDPAPASSDPTKEETGKKRRQEHTSSRRRFRHKSYFIVQFHTKPRHTEAANTLDTHPHNPFIAGSPIAEELVNCRPHLSCATRPSTKSTRCLALLRLPLCHCPKVGSDCHA